MSGVPADVAQSETVQRLAIRDWRGRLRPRATGGRGAEAAFSSRSAAPAWGQLSPVIGRGAFALGEGDIAFAARRAGLRIRGLCGPIGGMMWRVRLRLGERATCGGDDNSAVSAEG